MGVLYGTFSTVLRCLDQWIDAKSWDDINLLLELDEYYLCDYTPENIDRLCSMIDHNDNFPLIKTDDPRIFLPLEIADVIYDEYGVLSF